MRLGVLVFWVCGTAVGIAGQEKARSEIGWFLNPFLMPWSNAPAVALRGQVPRALFWRFACLLSFPVT
jgi:hypothetical protein